jgi:hypothetical protein
MFILFIIAGMILIVAGFLLVVRIQYIRNGIITAATVKHCYIVEAKSSDDSDTLHVVFKFFTQNNEEINFEEEFSVNASWYPGDKATIVYQTYNPQRVVFLTYWRSFGLVTVLFAVALLLILIAAVYYRAEHFFNSL